MRFAQIGVIVLTLLLASAPSALRAADGDPVDALLSGVAPAADRYTMAQAREAFGEYARRLGIVQDSVERCLDFSRRYGADAKVRALLRKQRERPGVPLFTTPELVDNLAKAVGKPIALTQFDLEHCAQLRDRRAGQIPGTDPASLAEIDASLGRCLAVLKTVSPNPSATQILQDLRRYPRDGTFTAPETLPALQNAAHRSLAINARDLETCVDAYHLQAALKPVFVGDNPPPCGPNEDYCAATGGLNPICCSEPGEVCEQVCAGPTCEAACVAQWCFPADATVRTESGETVRIADVAIGDRVQVARPDGSLGYETVYLNTHRDALSTAPFVELALRSGRRLTLSPRHFLPVATDVTARWEGREVRGADEVRPGDTVWVADAGGAMGTDEVVAVATRLAVGAYNPLTMGGTIVVDGVVASAHSDWFLDGVVPAASQAAIYQAILAPVRAAYTVIGPEWMTTVTEEWGVVDLARGATAPGGGSILPWVAVGLGIACIGGLVLSRRRRAA